MDHTEELTKCSQQSRTEEYLISPEKRFLYLVLVAEYKVSDLLTR